jgi:holo-[acyl-carrier protein] synthase
MKALGLGWNRMAWREIEIGGDREGRPVVRLTGRAAQAAVQLGVRSCLVSISHTRDLAVAHAVAE